MEELLSKLRPNLLLTNIRGCIDKEKIDIDLPDHRFLLFQVAGPVSWSYISYFQDHAPTADQIAGRVFERARPRGSALPQIEYGAVFDVKTSEILAYMVRSL
jgi:hypothetical protein